MSLGRPMYVLVAGVLSNTGQLVARSLAESADFKVTALCSPSFGATIKDDNSKLSETPVKPFSGQVPVDAVVIALDDPLPPESVTRLLEECGSQGVNHAVLLSRLGGSQETIGTGAWKAVEEAASACCPNLTIMRVGAPLIGGPFYAAEPDLSKYQTAKATDGYLTAAVEKGDTLRQGGFGGSRIVAASAVASALRRGPEGQSSYAVTCSLDGGPTTAEMFDALMSEAASGAAGGPVAGAENLKLDEKDELLQPLLLPFRPPPPSPVELLRANFFGNPAAAGPNWFTLAFFLYGMWQCAQPDYIARTGVDVFGLAPSLGLEVELKANPIKDAFAAQIASLANGA